MKKIILLAGILLCLTGCKHSESTDLRLLDLKGNVESVTMYTTEYVDSLGNKTRLSYHAQDATFIFDENGCITAGYDMDQELQISRNDAGYIEYIILPNEVVDMNGFLVDWNDGGYTLCYKWNSAGWPESIGHSYVGDHMGEILYDQQYNRIGEKTIGRIENDEGEYGYQNIKHYKILETDSYGNWTKRVEKSEYTEFDENNNPTESTTSYTLRERAITYYEKSY